MGFAQEVKDFTQNFLAMRKQMAAETATDARAKYYAATIGLRQQAAKSQDAHRRATLGLRAQSNALRAQSNKLRALDVDSKVARRRASTELDRKKFDAKNAPLIPDEIRQKYQGALPIGPQSTVAGSDANAQAFDPTDYSDPNDAEDTETEDVTAPEDEEDDEPEQSFSAGGAVRRYAGGGAVESDLSAEIADNAKPAQAVGGAIDPFAPPSSSAAPLTPAQPSAPAPSERGDGGTSSSDGFSVSEAIRRWNTTGSTTPNPVALGLKAMQAGIKSKGVSQPDDSPLSPKRAPAMNEVEDLRKVIDPDNELSKHAQTLKMLDATTSYYLSRGDTRKAAQVASLQLMHGRQMSMKMGAMAAAAIQAGNKEHALKFLRAAYDYVPDGKTLDASLDENGNFLAKVVGPEGEVVRDLGVISPQQAFKFAMGNVASGQEYMRGVISVATQGKSEVAAEQRRMAAQGKGVKDKGAKVPSLRDRKTAGEMVDAEAGTDAKTKYKLGDETVAPAKDIAANLVRANNISSGDAMATASMLFDPGKKLPTKLSQDGGAVVQLPDKREVVVPREAWLQIAAIRGKAVADKNAKAIKAAEEENASRQRGEIILKRQKPYIENPPGPGMIMGEDGKPRYPVDRTRALQVKR